MNKRLNDSIPRNNKSHYIYIIAYNIFVWQKVDRWQPRYHTSW